MELSDYLLQTRRALHRMPELSGREHRTAAFLRQELTAMGYQPLALTETGTAADLVSDPEAPWLLLRADIDALPIREETGLPFASENAGVMHACGHDGHMAMLLGAAKALRGERLPQNLRFVFQPAEENTTGARLLLEAGAIPGNTLASFALHLWPEVPFGVFACREGAMMASSDAFTVRFQGRAAHCGMRDLGADAIQAGARMLLALDRVEAALPPKEAALVFAGSLHGGTAHNVVADCCELEGTVRTLHPASRDRAEQELKRHAAALAAAFGVTAEVDYRRHCAPVLNSPAVVRKLRGLLPQLSELAEPSLAAEDFASYLELTGGALLFLGVGGENPLHSSRYTFNEDILAQGCRFFQTAARADWRV